MNHSASANFANKNQPKEEFKMGIDVDAEIGRSSQIQYIVRAVPKSKWIIVENVEILFISFCVRAFFFHFYYVAENINDFSSAR